MDDLECLEQDLFGDNDLPTETFLAEAKTADASMADASMAEAKTAPKNYGPFDGPYPEIEPPRAPRRVDKVRKSAPPPAPEEPCAPPVLPQPKKLKRVSEDTDKKLDPMEIRRCTLTGPVVCSCGMVYVEFDKFVRCQDTHNVRAATIRCLSASCSSMFTSLHDQASHFALFHPKEKPVLICPTCQSEFHEERQLKAHYHTQHATTISIRCVCGGNFNSMQEFLLHGDSSHGEIYYQLPSHVDPVMLEMLDKEGVSGVLLQSKPLDKVKIYRPSQVSRCLGLMLSGVEQEEVQVRLLRLYVCAQEGCRKPHDTGAQRTDAQD